MSVYGLLHSQMALSRPYPRAENLSCAAVVYLCCTVSCHQCCPCECLTPPCHHPLPHVWDKGNSTGAELQTQGSMIGILNMEQVGGMFLELLEWNRDLNLGISDFVIMDSAFICD